MSDELLWKATRPDGTTRGGVRWTVGETVTHPTSTAMIRDEPSTYLSLSTEPAETLIGGSWPCRLFRVEAVGDVIDSDNRRHKRCVLTARVVAEVEPWRALGPNGRTVAAVIDRCSRLTADEARQLAAAWDAARAPAWDAARAVVVADLITADQYELLTRPLVSVVGPLDQLPVPARADQPRAHGGDHTEGDQR